MISKRKHLILLVTILAALIVAIPQVFGEGPEWILFVLDYGETTHITPAHTTITFIKVVEDSRCPIKVTCPWPGAVEIQLEAYYQPVSVSDKERHHVDVSKEDFGMPQPDPYLINLRIDPTMPEASLATLSPGYVVELLQVDPYPVGQDPIPVEDYQIKLVVKPDDLTDLISDSLQRVSAADAVSPPHAPVCSVKYLQLYVVDCLDEGSDIKNAYVVFKGDPLRYEIQRDGSWAHVVIWLPEPTAFTEANGQFMWCVEDIQGNRTAGFFDY